MSNFVGRRTLSGEQLQNMTTGRGLLAGRLLAAGGLFLRADLCSRETRKDEGRPKPLLQFRAHAAASAEPTVVSPSAPGR